MPSSRFECRRRIALSIGTGARCCTSGMLTSSSRSPSFPPLFSSKSSFPHSNLPFEILPDTLSAHSFLDKLLTLPSGPKPTFAKLSQQNLGRQPCRSCGLSDHGTVTAPRPLLRLLHHSGPDR